MSDEIASAELQRLLGIKKSVTSERREGRARDGGIRPIAKPRG